MIHKDHPNMKVQLPNVQVVTAHNHAVLTNILGKNEILMKSSVLRFMCGCLHIHTALRPAAALYYIQHIHCVLYLTEKNTQFKPFIRVDYCWSTKLQLPNLYFNMSSKNLVIYCWQPTKFLPSGNNMRYLQQRFSWVAPPRWGRQLVCKYQLETANWEV